MSLPRLTGTNLRAHRTTSAAVATARLAAIRLMSTEAQYENILVSRPAPGVGQVTLHRPKALNALSTALFLELNEALRRFDGEDDVRALVITGSEKAFAAGADIKEMKDKEFADVYKNQFLENWSEITRVRKPIIAAVSGYALGGGCELALLCDIILASPSAVFGQPEINLGIIPGGGGTQRLARAIGKSRTMELTLTGRNFTAAEAAAWGMVSRVEDDVVGAAVKMAETIASKSAIAVQAGKEAVNEAYEGTLAESLKTERRLFHALFATKDQKEGMGAFAEKRKPTWSNA